MSTAVPTQSSHVTRLGQPFCAAGAASAVAPAKTRATSNTAPTAKALVMSSLFMSSLLLLYVQGVAAADPPGDLHVGFVSRDRETTVLEFCSDTGTARRLE